MRRKIHLLQTSTAKICLFCTHSIEVNAVVFSNENEGNKVRSRYFTTNWENYIQYRKFILEFQIFFSAHFNY